MVALATLGGTQDRKDFGLSSRTASGIAKNDTPRPGTSILIRSILASHGSTNLL
jgi:hypothetical protein